MATNKINRYFAKNVMITGQKKELTSRVYTRKDIVNKKILIIK